MMINLIAEEDFVTHFFDSMAEVECGSHFDLRNEFHVKWLRKKIAVHYFRGTRFYAYYHNDIPIGFVAVLIESGPEGIECLGQSTELLDIILLEEYRGKGYGKELLLHAEKISMESKAYCMYVSTYAKDYAVIAFYGKNGYIPVANCPDVHGPNDEGKVWMRKIINETHV
jgi:ribosomal protein S18 acetylase RimI-like enzyme